MEALWIKFKAIMAGIKALVGLAFLGSVALLFLFLACALPSYNNWWPLFTALFYVLSPLPTIFARRFTDDLNTTSALKEVCYFLTTGIVLSAFALPIVLARAPSGKDDHVIQWGAACLVMTGNVVMFLTILGFFLAFDNEDGFEYSSGWGMT